MTFSVRSGAQLAAMLLAASVVAGCTSTSAGEPRPADTTPNGGASSQDTPTRPREIRLDDVDPCALIPESDYSDYYIDEPGKPEHDETYDASACAWLPDEAAFSIILVTREGIEVWTDGSKLNQGNPVDPIVGYSAVTVQLKGEEDSGCFVAVDVADGQYLFTQVGILETRAAQLPAPCEYAHQFATSAMSTLVER